MGVSIAKKAASPGQNEYAEHLASEPVTATTTITKVKTSNGVKSEEVVKAETQVLAKGLQVPESQLCRLMVGGGQTINLGNYESARIDVQLQVPTAKSDLEEAWEFASNWVSNKIGESVGEAKG